MLYVEQLRRRNEKCKRRRLDATSIDCAYRETRLLINNILEAIAHRYFRHAPLLTSARDSPVTAKKRLKQITRDVVKRYINGSCSPRKDREFPRNVI